MSNPAPYTPDRSSPRWPLYAMLLLATAICIMQLRACTFYPETHSETAAPPATATETAK